MNEPVPPLSDSKKAEQKRVSLKWLGSLLRAFCQERQPETEALERFALEKEHQQRRNQKQPEKIRMQCNSIQQASMLRNMLMNRREDRRDVGKKATITLV